MAAFEWDPDKAARYEAKHGVAFTERGGRIRIISARAATATSVATIATMKKLRAKPTQSPQPSGTRATPPANDDPDEILPKYDVSRSRPNPYAAQFAAGSAMVVLEPDVAAAFPDAGKVNAVLRAVAGIIRGHRPPRARPRRSA